MFVFLVAPSSADCFSDCDYGCDDLLAPGSTHLWMRCLRECYEYCIYGDGDDRGIPAY